MRSNFGTFILNSPHRIPMPIGVYAGLEITGASVKDAVTSSQHQSDAVLALHERFHTQVMLTAMDLSAEAEIFGCQIRMSDNEIPTVIGRLVTSEKEIDILEIPSAGDGRTAVHLQTARKLVSQANGVSVLGSVIGPFSLASRLFGVSEALELSLADPALLNKLLHKATKFLTDYVLAFRAQGVDGVIMAEPAAGLLSPRGLSQFSSDYIRQIVKETQSEEFTLVLHNCGAKIVHLHKILEAGAEIFHFGAPMDIEQALKQVSNEVILAGNLDPTNVFHNGTAIEVTAQTLNLMKITSGYKNFIASSGCDIPPQTPVENLDAFYTTIRKNSNSNTFMN
jgi:uroporphyrinogen decarboxylase